MHPDAASALAQWQMSRQASCGGYPSNLECILHPDAMFGLMTLL
jgi:hypothetical protein